MIDGNTPEERLELIEPPTKDWHCMVCMLKDSRQAEYVINMRDDIYIYTLYLCMFVCVRIYTYIHIALHLYLELASNPGCSPDFWCIMQLKSFGGALG